MISTLAQQNQILFFRWLKRNHPDIFAAAANHVPLTLGDLGWVESLVNALATVGTAVLAKKQADKAIDLQKKQLAANQANQDAQLKAALLQVNYQRAQAGLAPVDANGNVLTSAQLPAPAGQQISFASATPSNSLGLSLPVLAIGAGGVLLAIYLLRR